MSERPRLPHAAEADWGIEETPRFGSVSDYQSRFGESSTPAFESSVPLAHSLEHDYGDTVTDRVARYIKTLAPAPLRHYEEQFKYALVVSNLLDDTLVLSKNEQALKTLLERQKPARYNRHYKIRVPAFCSHKFVLYTVNCVIFLLKQRLRTTVRPRCQVHMFKCILAMAGKMMKYRRMVATAAYLRALGCVERFMVANCRVNRALIGSVISLKEYEMFSYLSKTNSRYVPELTRQINTTLSCLLVNIKHLIGSVLPLCNGPMLEQYCAIHGVHLAELFEQESEELLLEALTAKLSQFNSLRRFFVCQLLTVHDLAACNFFLLKLHDLYSTEPQQAYVGSVLRFALLSALLESHTRTLDEIHTLLEKFRHLHNQHSDYANDDVLVTQKFDRDTAVPREAELNLSNLIDKLHGLATSLRYFKKYSASILLLQDAEEYNEKMTIFRLFGAELKEAASLYSACAHDYHSEYTERADNVSLGSHLGEFSLKLFRTSPKNNAVPERKDRSKRLLGLQLGLLTVLEEPEGRDPPPYELYNQAALDALTRKHPRFSINSLSLNVSGITDLIASMDDLKTTVSNGAGSQLGERKDIHFM